MAFISFRGKIRYGFVSFVCYSFLKEKIPLIIDEKFPRGRDIKKEIEEAIEKAQVLIPIICKDYATSVWCLDELVLIVKYRETKHILPVLYRVNWEDVMPQEGCFETALADLRKTYPEDCPEERVDMWSTAFSKIAEFTPHLVRIDRHESEVVENITRDVCKMLKRDCSLDTKGPHDATMNIRTAPDQISSQLGSGIPFSNEYPKAKMMTPPEMNSEVGLLIKEEVSRIAYSKRNFLESHVAAEEEELPSLFNEMKYSSSSEDDEQDVDGHPLVEIRTSLKTVIHGFSLGASVLQDAGMLAKLKDSLAYLSQNFGEKLAFDGLKEMLKQQEAELMAANNILYEAFSQHDRKVKAGKCLKEQYRHLQELWSEKMAQEKAETDLKEQQQALENQASGIDAKLHAARASKVRLEHKTNLCRVAAALQEGKTKRCSYELEESRPAFEEAKADVGLTLEGLNNQIEDLSFLLSIFKSCGGLPC